MLAVQLSDERETKDRRPASALGIAHSLRAIDDLIAQMTKHGIYCLAPHPIYHGIIDLNGPELRPEVLGCYGATLLLECSKLLPHGCIQLHDARCRDFCRLCSLRWRWRR